MAEIRSVVGFLIVLVYASSVANEAATSFSPDEWCGRTSRSKVCLDTIRQDPRSGLKNDPNSLCAILNDKSKTFAESTLSKIKDALGQRTDPVTQQALGICFDAYDQTLGILRRLNFNVIEGQKWLMLNGGLQSARQVVQKCGDATPRFSGEENFLGDLLAVTSDIVNLVECGKFLCE